jgi:8-oxo-dGTP pyrophosphatase MutT (NUDIX family)
VVFTDGERLSETSRRRALVSVLGTDGTTVAHVDGTAVFAHSGRPAEAPGDTAERVGAFVAALVRLREPAQAWRAALDALEPVAAPRVSARDALLADNSWVTDPRGGGPFSELVDATATFVVRDSSLLLVEKPDDRAFEPGVLYVPGGKLESGENPEACARRELAEETGLRGGELELIGVFVYRHPRIHERLYRFWQYAVLGAEGEARPASDVVSCRWERLDAITPSRLFGLTWAQIRLSQLAGSLP